MPVTVSREGEREGRRRRGGEEENGGWKMEDGGWRMEDGREMGDGRSRRTERRTGRRERGGRGTSRINFSQGFTEFPWVSL
jgi:hypothetical protein